MTDEDLLLPGGERAFGSGIIGVCDVCGRRQAVVVLEKERFKLCVLDFLNKTWVTTKNPPGRPLPPYRSERVWFDSESSPSGKAPAVILQPTKPVRHPAVLLTPDVYGLTTMWLDAGLRFAHAGFEVLMPDVGKFEGLSPGDHFALRRDTMFRGGVRLDSARVRRLVEVYLDALRYLRGRPMVDPLKSAVFGASYGASLALAVAVVDRDLAATALAFPLPVHPAEYLKLLNAPVLVVSGARDAPARKARAQLESVHHPPEVVVEFHELPGAGHLFLSRDRRGYQVSPAEAGWKTILQFFRERLLPTPPRPPVPPVTTALPPPPNAPASPAGASPPTPKPAAVKPGAPPAPPTTAAV